MSRYICQARTGEWERMIERITLLWAPSLRSRLRFVNHRYTNKGSPAPRVELLLDGERIWCFPDDYLDAHTQGWVSHPYRVMRSGGWTDYSARDLYGTFRNYLDTPRDKLLEPIEGLKLSKTEFCDYHVHDILRAADRRIGYKRLLWWTITEMGSGASPARKVLTARFGRN